MKFRIYKLMRLALFCSLFSGVAASVAFAEEVIKPKVVILGYFETSKEYGVKGYWGEAAKPGELYYWLKGLGLSRRIDVAGAFEQAWANADGSIIALKIGPNSLHPAVNITALGLDAKFDLRQSYWLFSGIAGTSPENGTIGDIVWTDFIINGDVAHEIDAREIPKGWPSGYFPAGSTQPYPQPRVAEDSSDNARNWDESFTFNRSRTVFKLNQQLLNWAYQLTQAEVLPESKQMQQVRAEYAQKAAQQKSAVKVGAMLSAETFWLGDLMDGWAHQWVNYMSDGQAEFRTTSTNDAGSMVALAALAQHGKIDPERVLLLRGASNFDKPPAGISAAEQLVREGPQDFAGYIPALEGIYQVGGRVVNELVNNWDKYQNGLPGR
ncbi:purine nucleoside permease [Halioxenophilus sp. WMMB6]|uniref:purine nucleoside permease n=1 Tax=Halioxenophilus sp. WMMB6 TaxID=3073815 RepID=UPI00295EEAF0|nr:purine nucleoside permease [Halioxenophilus sp. WMMB6]